MINVQLVQVNSSYGNQYFIPYSVGLLQSFSTQYPEITDNFNFKKLIYKQELDLEEQVKSLGKLDIVGQSCYVWNWHFNLAFAKLVKKHNPDALIVLGGPQVPDKSKGFFKKYPFVDILCHGEGEIVFTEILKKYVNTKDYNTIEGVSFNDRVNNKTIQTDRAKRALELEHIPSPYLDETFSSLINEDVIWQASWETNRGCPYRCTFCVWGAEYYNKIRKFSFEDRLLLEIDWFSNNKIGLVFGCDANFGVFKRDLDIAKALVTNKQKFGYPQKFRVCNAKNSNQLVYEISEVLNDAGMDKGTSMSVQSMNPNVLETIKRKNIGLDKFKDLMSKFNASNIATYTEIILPLPGESYKSFVSGLDTLFHGGQHSQLNIYNCTILANSEMADDEYVKEHEIQMVETPVFQAHVDNMPNQYVEEKEIIAIGTKTMPKNDWNKCQQYSWAVQTYHTLGLLQFVAITIVNRYNINYSDFYLALIEYATKNPDTVLGLELKHKDKSTNNILLGKSQGQLVPEYNLNIIWPTEEASLLRILDNIDNFYDECSDMIKYFLTNQKLEIEEDFLHDLISFQKEMMVHYNDAGDTVELKLNHNIPDYVADIKKGITSTLKNYSEPKNYNITKIWKDSGNKQEFAREIVWYGRKGGKFINELNIMS
mgnify:CR=1 FL=1|tara:strand:- start:5234 stop:7192 length:1959 start_codon:yes stop_codon:yes gene_type:complete